MTRSNHILTGRVAREQRQADAKKRAEARAKRSAKTQLGHLKKRPGNSARETARLKAAS